MSSENNYLLLYRLDDKLSPYRPTAKWCANSEYKPEEFLITKDKVKFVPDEFLVTKREFIRDNF